MIASLRELVEPLSEDEFLGLLRSRTLTFRRAAGGHRYSELFDWEKLRGAIAAGAIPAERLTVTKNTAVVPSMMYAKDGVANAASIAALLDQGASLIATRLNLYLPAFGALCENIRAQLGEEIMAGTIVTVGEGGALKRHYDEEDIVILQVEGTKRWRIYDTPVANPVKHMARRPPPATPVFDEVLAPGDFLFLPAGYWHQCENGPGRSLHLTILFIPPLGLYALDRLKAQLRGDENFRVPLTRFVTAAEKAAHEAALKAHLAETIAAMALSDLPERRKAGSRDPSADE